MFVAHEELPDRVRLLENLFSIFVRQPEVNLRVFTSRHRTHSNYQPFCRVAFVPLQDFAVENIDTGLIGAALPAPLYGGNGLRGLRGVGNPPLYEVSKCNAL